MNGVGHEHGIAQRSDRNADNLARQAGFVFNKPPPLVKTETIFVMALYLVLIQIFPAEAISKENDLFLYFKS